MFIKRLLFVILFSFFISLFCFGQKKKKDNYKVADQISIDTSTFLDKNDDPEFQFIFNNINRINYYQDPVLLGQIKKLEAQGDFDNLKMALTNYITKFGIQNFYKDTELIWKLAQLYEKDQQVEEAVFLYKLVLKHHRHTIDGGKVRRHYDTLSENIEDRYVPLNYYYELVEYRRSIDTLRPPHGVFINMGSEINSKKEDYAPTMSVDENTIFFTSKRGIPKSAVSQISNEDIYFSKMEDGLWNDAEPFKAINSIYNEGSACITRDGRTLYFSRCDSPDGYGNCDLYITSMDDQGIWSKPANLGVFVNSKSWDSQPALSHSEDTLYFASDRIGGFGLADIYYTIKDPLTGRWFPAQNLGPIINTRENEASPFIHPNYNVLYFSSTGHMLKFGNFDIYKSRNISGMWQEPRSTGPLVNGKGSEYYFTIDADAKNLYYARSEENDVKNLDLFSFPLPMEAQPNAITELKGSLTDSATGKPFHGIVSVIDITNGLEVAPKELRPDGSFNFDLIDHADYLLIIQGEDFFRVEQKIHLNGDTSLKIRTPSIKFKRLQFASLNFENGKADILEEMHGDLDKLFNYLIDNPEVKLTISGHTDTDGDPKANLDLSQRRADAIKNYLTLNDLVEKERITAIGYGSSKPIKEELTMEDKKVNRRVEFQIIRPDEH